MSSSAIRPERTGTIATLLIEAAVLSIAASAFLASYVQGYAGPTTSIAPHFMLVFALAGIPAGLRLAARRWLPQRLGEIASAALLTAFVFILWTYYALTLVGLGSWGRVISWLLIKGYAPQISPLLKTLGYEPLLAAAIGALVIALLFALMLAWVRRHDWAAAAAARGTPVLLAIASAALVSIGLSQMFAWSMERAMGTGEPVSLTFFPDHAAQAAQNHRTDGDTLTKAADAEARRTYVPAHLAKRPNLILIVGDGLRADHLGVFGYARETTPFLQSLDRAGSLRKASQMRSVCGESTCGLMGIAKSAYASSLYLGAFSLTEVLKLHGYHTRMVLGGDHTNFYGLRAAFGAIDEFFDGSMATDMYVNDDRLVLRHVDSLPEWDGTPQYIQFHLMSSHGSGTHFMPPRFQPQQNFYTNMVQPGLTGEFTEPTAVNYYDNGMLQIDWVIEQILAKLGEKGYLQDALVAVSGDHGDMLGEFGEFAHAHSVREGALRVPFLLAGFGRIPLPFVDAEALTSQADIAPTLAFEIGIPAPANWQGQPLQRERTRSTLLFQQRLQVGAYDAASRDPIWKYVRDMGTGAERLSKVADGVEIDSELDAIDEARLNMLRTATLKAASSAFMLGTDRTSQTQE